MRESGRLAGQRPGQPDGPQKIRVEWQTVKYRITTTQVEAAP
jgi:hypothetical protein